DHRDRNSVLHDALPISKGLTEVIKSDRVIEAIIYSDNNINFSRNPMIPVQTTDPVTGETRTEYKPMFEGGKGVVIPELYQEGIRSEEHTSELQSRENLV